MLQPSTRYFSKTFTMFFSFPLLYADCQFIPLVKHYALYFLKNVIKYILLF